MSSSSPEVFVHPTAVVDDGAAIGGGTKVWHFAHVFGGAKIGRRCSFGQNTMVSDGVVVGDNVKVQNNVAIYAGTTIESDVFLGPSCVLTNVSNPRSQVVRRSIYEETRLCRGATVGANATIVCGVTIGRYAFIAAGAVVTGDVGDYEMIVGVPGRVRGFMSRHGHKLEFDAAGLAICPESGLTYEQQTDAAGRESVRCRDLDEEAALPDSLAVGAQSYRTFRRAG